MKRSFTFACLLILLVISSLAPSAIFASEEPNLSQGQTIYIPAYSHIYSGNQERPFLLAVTLSIRNIDPLHKLTINVVDYYETHGTLLKKYLDKSVILGPLESIRYIVPEEDKSGGSGANFIVEWESEKFINPPIAETIMIGTQNQQGISFTSRGQEIVTHK